MCVCMCIIHNTLSTCTQCVYALCVCAGMDNIYVHVQVCTIIIIFLLAIARSFCRQIVCYQRGAGDQ